MTIDETGPPDSEGMIEDFGLQALSFTLLTTKDLAPTLGHFARLQGERAAQLSGAEARLEGQLGKQHPRVSALSEAVETARSLERSLRRAAARETRRPEPVVGGWMVYGRVLDPEGRPVPDVRVQVLDDDPLWDDLVGRARTDEYGYFDVVYDAGDFGRLLGLERRPDLYVRVEDRQGNVLYETSQGEIRHDADRIEYFQVVLDQSPSAPPLDNLSPRPPIERAPEAPSEERNNVWRDAWNRLRGRPGS